MGGGIDTQGHPCHSAIWPVLCSCLAARIMLDFSVAKLTLYLFVHLLALSRSWQTWGSRRNDNGVLSWIPRGSNPGQAFA